MSKADDERALATGESWKSFGAAFGWTLYGWTFEHSARFRTGDTATIDISLSQRQAIEKPIAALVQLVEELAPEPFDTSFVGMAGYGVWEKKQHLYEFAQRRLKEILNAD